MAPKAHYHASECWSRDQVLDLQWRKLTYRLDHLYRTNPYYQARFKEAGLTPGDIKTRKDFARFPLSTKADFLNDQQAFPPYGSRLGVAERQIMQITTTAGTTGKGQEVHCMTGRDVKVMASAAAATWHWAGLRQGDIGVFNGVLGNHIGGWTWREGILALTGRMPYYVGGYSFPERLELMHRFGVHGFWAAPSGLNGFTQICIEKGIDPRSYLPNLKFVLMAAESYPHAWAQRMQEFWGVPLVEQFGATAAQGIIACCCPPGSVRGEHRGHMHFFDWFYYTEVINPDTGEHVQPGEAGELILTSLDWEASPIVRFSTRDRVTWFPYTACDCGLPFDFMEAGTIGRLDDMLKVKGQNVWPAQFDSVIFAHEGVDEYQARVFIGDKGRDEIEIRIAFGPSVAHLSPAQKAELMARISAQIKENTYVTASLVETAPENLPHYVGAERKPRRWTDERAAGLMRG